MSTNPPRLTVTHGSFTHSNHPNTATTATIPIIRSTSDDYREMAREQSFMIPNSPPNVPVRRYSPLPYISMPSVNNSFFRTETSFIAPKQTQSKKQVCNHFGRAQHHHHHLPALKQHQNVTSAMDLDEDLPQVNTNSTYRAATYTSPGERIISPIKRPSAPSPPTSAQIKRLTLNSFMDGDDDDGGEEQEERYGSRLDYEDSQLFNEHFFRYQQPIIMNHRRIDHHNRHSTNEYDDLIHPFNSNEFEP